jgi:UDP-N-acetylmuramate dehydrogenase
VEGSTLALQLKDTVRGQVFANEPMWRHTSFRIGGPADVLVVPEDISDLMTLIKSLSDLQTSFHIMGAGTNLLVKDQGIRGVVVKIASTLSHINRLGDGILRCGAGALLPSVCRNAAAMGLAGLEFAGGIPGTVGGAVAMNAAAFGGVMADLVDTAEVITYDGRQIRLDRENLDPGTKTTRILAEPLILTEVDFALRRDQPERVQERMQKYLKERTYRQPLSLPSAGCAFKNPTGKGAGRFIDAAGLKGFKVGSAEVSRLHANFIVNNGGATCEDVISLMKHVQEVVYSKFQVMLEPEVRILGG